MAEEKPQDQVQVETLIYALTGLNILFDEEEFVFIMRTGNQMRRYLATPKHAKRILLLLQKQIADYESKFGKLQTELPQAKEQSSEEGVAGFLPKK